MCRGGHERSAALSRTSSRLLLVSRSAAISVRRLLSQYAGRCLSPAAGGFPTVSLFPRGRGGGSDVKCDRHDAPGNCARWFGKWMSHEKSRFVCGLISLYLFSEKQMFHNFFFFLQITLRAFQRTYSELLAHLELGDNDVQS